MTMPLIHKTFSSSVASGSAILESFTAHPSFKTQKISHLLSEKKENSPKTSTEASDIQFNNKVVSLDSIPNTPMNSNPGQQSLGSLEIHPPPSGFKLETATPKTMADLDFLSKKILSAGVDLQSDNPGFHDPIYRRRRQEIASIALSHSCIDANIPVVSYTPEEVSTWSSAFDVLTKLHTSYACEEYLDCK